MKIDDVDGNKEDNSNDELNEGKNGHHVTTLGILLCIVLTIGSYFITFNSFKLSFDLAVLIDSIIIIINLIVCIKLFRKGNKMAGILMIVFLGPVLFAILAFGSCMVAFQNF